MVGHCSSGVLLVEKLGSRSTEALRLSHGKALSEINSNVDSAWWLNQSIWKIWVKIQNVFIFPNVRGENKKMLKPPPSDLIEKYPPEV